MIGFIADRSPFFMRGNANAAVFTPDSKFEALDFGLFCFHGSFTGCFLRTNLSRAKGNGVR